MQESYRRLVVRLREDRKTSWSKILIEGKTVHNPIPEHPDICPFDCKKSPNVQVSHFLIRHHADRSIGLFSCDGCPHLLFKGSIIPTHSLPESMISVPTDSEASPVEPIVDAVKIETKTTRILDRGTSKRITLPKRWIPKIGRQNVNMHLIRETKSGRSFILIDFSSLDNLEEQKLLEPQSTDPISISDDYITLTKNTHHRLQGRRIDLVCRLCGNSIRIGEQYRRTRTSKVYHKECWESLFIKA